MGGLVGHSKECIFSSDCMWKPLGRDRTWWISRDHCGFSAENGEGSSERILWTFIFLHHKRKQIVAWARIRLSHLIVYLNIWSVDLGGNCCCFGSYWSFTKCTHVCYIWWMSWTLINVTLFDTFTHFSSLLSAMFFLRFLISLCLTYIRNHFPRERFFFL